ncbi:hypothetical protein TNCV_3425251 [Trichonephila clavipes]|nr:hypothetical protein TNCV_3425251 [Trichonephila clavipes]
MELSRDCKGVRDHRGVALDQEVGNDEGCVAGGIVMVELDRVFNYKLTMDYSSDVKEDNDHRFDARLAHSRFLGSWG